MKKTRERILSLLLTAVMLFSLLPAAAGTASAAGETAATTTITVTPGDFDKTSNTFKDLSLTCDGFTGTIDSGYIEITVGTGCTVKLPSSVAVDGTTLTVGTSTSVATTYDFTATATSITNSTIDASFAGMTLAQIQAVLRACTFTLASNTTADVTFKVGSTPIITYSGSGQHYRFIAYPKEPLNNQRFQTSIA